MSIIDKCIQCGVSLNYLNNTDFRLCVDCKNEDETIWRSSDESIYTPYVETLEKAPSDYDENKDDFEDSLDYYHNNLYEQYEE